MNQQAEIWCKGDGEGAGLKEEISSLCLPVCIMDGPSIKINISKYDPNYSLVNAYTG